jgi:hypothetical protein
MAKRSSFLLRIDPQVMDAVRRWADDELRSVNGQLEFLIRRAVKEDGRLPTPKTQERVEESKGDGTSSDDGASRND